MNTDRIDVLESGPGAALSNPLLEGWRGPYGGVPPLDRVQVAHFMPALDGAIRAKLAEVEGIASNPEPATFDNTLSALERSGGALHRVEAIATIWRSTMSTPELQALEGEMAAKLADLDDRIKQNAALFRRIEAVYEGDDAGLSAEQRRLAWLYHTDFVRAGAALGEPAKKRLAEINQRIAELSTRFDQNVLADETDQYLLLGSEAELAGLPRPERDAAAAAAEARGFRGQWLIANTRSAVEPFVTYAERRDLRERALAMFLSRGDSERERDNKPILREMLVLRAERARLLGYASHAHWATEKAMAKTPERALALMEAVWPHAVGKVREEVADMVKLARADGVEAIQPWDYRYYAEKVRRPRYDLDWHEVEPYLQLEKLREGMFWVAGELFGMEFRSVSLPVNHPDVRVWEVSDRESGRHVGLFYFDPFARAGKKSGAWMNHYRRQNREDGVVTPIVSNNCNYLRGRPDEPVLISWIDAVTLFHEFGHALHGLLSSVTYRSLAGTSVSADYVEFPSQVLEFWLSTPEVLQRFAVHHETGEPISADLIARIERASNAAEGFSTTEQLASGLVDMRLHLETDGEVDPERIERETLAHYGMPAEVAMRHRPPHFGHIFSGDHYAAKYYSYLWADVLAADAGEAFREAGGMFDPDTAQRLREQVLSRGNTVDAEEAYRAFRGRDPQVEALMRKRGFLAS